MSIGAKKDETRVYLGKIMKCKVRSKRERPKSFAIHLMLVISHWIIGMPVMFSVLMLTLTAVSILYPKDAVGRFLFSQKEKVVLNEVNKWLSDITT